MKARNAMLALAAAVVALAASQAQAVDFHGYLRSGIGSTQNGGDQQCYGNGDVGHKFRLGNECENYAELEFAQTLYKDKSGVQFKYDGMLNYITNAARDYELLTPPRSGGDHQIGEIGLRQNWVGATFPQLGNATFWIGKRYYHRNDVHIIDYFYWDPSGAGAGVEDVDLGGFGKFAVAVFQTKKNANDGGLTNGTMWRPDIRVYGIPLWTNASLEVGVDLFIPTEKLGANQMDISPWGTAQLTMTDVLGGFNKLAVQYAVGSAAPMSQYPAFGNSSDAVGWRVLDHQVFNIGSQFSGAFVLQYADRKQQYSTAAANKDATWNTNQMWEVGGRIAHHLNDYYKTNLEAGYQNIKYKGQDAVGGYKITLAPTITPAAGPGGAFFTRPELRLFATYFGWDKAPSGGGQGFLPDNATVAGGGENGDSSTFTFGAQVEAWF